jgi:membrane associated rhomboid family serine protease
MKTMKLTYWLAIILVVIFCLQLLVDPELVLNEFGFSGTHVLQKPWTPLSAMFLHADLGHLLANILVLVFFGRAVEAELGPWRTLAIFLAAGLAGDVLSLWVYPPETISIGASAGIFGLVGVGMLIKPVGLSPVPYVVPLPLLLVGLLYAFYNIFGFFVNPEPHISYAGHLGGLLVGLGVGFYYRGLRKGLAILAIGVAVLIVALLAIPLLMAMLS